MRVDFSDYEQEFICFLINLLKTIDLSKFPPNDENGLTRYICKSITHKYLAIAKKKQNEINNCADIKDEVFDIATIIYSRPESPNNTYFKNEEFLELKIALSKLTKKQKQVIFYKFICGISDVEIGERLNITRQSVNQIKNRALKTLKDYLQGRC